jgi:2'-5' RNA ligase
VTVARLALVGYPTLDDADRRWIESVRARHDPASARIGAHLTLVFPAEAAPEPVADHVRDVAAHEAAIPFVLRRAEPCPDRVAGAGGHVFLVPEEGRDALVALHDRLYRGVLRPHLRSDLPYLPHLTVGAAGDLEECRRLARSLNEAGLAVRGLVASLDLVEVPDGEGPVRPIRTFTLGPTGRPSRSR